MDERHLPPEGAVLPDTDGVREASETVSHSDFKDFFRKYVSGTEPIPWNEFFSSVGLRLDRKQIQVADPGFTLVQNFGMPPIVVSVNRGSAAERAGLSTGDSVIEIDGHAISRDFDSRMARLLQVICCVYKSRTHWASEKCNGQSVPATWCILS